MRRILAITLLIAFGFPLAQPILAATADPEAQLPACCRRHGAHHCGMRMAAMMAMMAASNSGPTFTAPPCPFYPAPATTPQFSAATIRTSRPQIAGPLPIPATLAAPGAHRPHTILTSANPKRGPPSIRLS
jgi:hypothetical protein